MLEWSKNGDFDERRVFIFFHKSDFDGKMSATIVGKKEKGKMFFCGVDYGDKYDFESIQQNDLVYILDFSFRKPDLEKILQKTKNIIWLDHHKVNYEAIYNDFPESRLIKGSRNDKFSGCELTWLWFEKQYSLEKFYQYDMFKLELPLVIYLLGRYDVWDKSRAEFETDIKDFQYGLRSYQTDMTTYEGLKEMLNIYLLIENNEFVRKVKEIGKSIRFYEDQKINPMLQLLSFEVTFENLKACVINAFEKSSDAFKPVIDNYDLCITMFYIPKNKNWEIHMYSTNPNVHVGKICQKFGGGGHPGAAGCTMTFEQVNQFFFENNK